MGAGSWMNRGLYAFLALIYLGMLAVGAASYNKKVQMYSGYSYYSSAIISNGYYDIELILLGAIGFLWSLFLLGSSLYRASLKPQYLRKLVMAAVSIVVNFQFLFYALYLITVFSQFVWEAHEDSGDDDYDDSSSSSYDDDDSSSSYDTLTALVTAELAMVVLSVIVTLVSIGLDLFHAAINAAKLGAGTSNGYA
ncbi:hypothetical protein F5Y15DRAFT_414741 [Xylariaceae sp. FL0016]|nr:hypothetical protein F5Y15DRAFT_414741 [Xylariaceae sp. FL0016]